MTESRALDLFTIVPGTACGRVVLLREPLSFWGGYDSESGRVIDQSHPQCGQSLRGVVLLMSKAKGSSSSSSVIAEAIRKGTGPAAIVMRERDLIVALGSLVAAELYGVRMPVAMADDAAWQTLSSLAEDAEVSLSAESDVASIYIERNLKCPGSPPPAPTS